MVNTQVTNLEIGPMPESTQDGATTNDMVCQKVQQQPASDLLDEEAEEEDSLETNTISLTSTDDDDREDKSEIIQLQYDDDDADEYYISGDDEKEEIGRFDSDNEEEEEEEEEEEQGLLTDQPRYKRMNLKGESESDKDLIIYSLNESLQIHKEIVERIQNEKDDIEYQYEQERELENQQIQKEKDEREEEAKIAGEKLGRLEGLYQSLLKELEAKKLDYRRMESRFHSHVKNIRNSTDQVSIEQQLRSVIQKVSDLCLPLSDTATASTLDYFFGYWPDMMQHFFENEELDTAAISLLTEKLLMDTIMQDILQTSIHPGVSLNHAFGKIHHWVEKRNTSWAARMKQQISSFVVKQSNEEAEAIEAATNRIIDTTSQQLCQIYNVVDAKQTSEIKLKWSNIVHDALQLNTMIKCQEHPTIEILHIEEGAYYNESTMESSREGGVVAFVITPPFVASSSSSDEDGFMIPAKVYCV
ncbi:uncharacterized protein ATC70_003272 [Mucor velutinosus]|uniref:Uncharacterized protein n=1 Tax=Mucor velutinosus TaxID=708070 RepID=A0AAN7HL93_9FUNG|nr:hypothetical protein ATC70_003272 [Mucor velutinosus]